MPKKFLDSNKNSLIFIAGLVVFTGLNIFSALTMDLHFDEAYYWLWSQTPSFGYFDHPPMAAWLIYAGQLLFKGEIGVRLLTLVLSTFSIIIIWRIVKRRYSDNAFLFWMLIYSVCLIHPYTFIATNDAPLFFFTALFFYYFSSYLEKNSFQNAVILAFVIALMIYSKYHAFLLLGLVVLFNLKLLKRFSFWIIVLLSLIYLTPHITWLAENNFAPFRYQLFEGHKSAFSILTPINYIFSELAAIGPISGWLCLYILFAKKTENQWEKTLKYTGAGIFIFFLLSTLKGNFQAHWTLVAVVPLLILSFKFLTQNPKWQKLIIIGGIFNFVMLLVVRLLILTPAAKEVKVLSQFSGNKESVEKIEKTAGNNIVVFQDAWIDASLYSFYSNNSKVPNLNSAFFRKNQYDIFDNDELIKNKKVTVLTGDSLQFSNPEIVVTKRSVFYAKTFENFNSYYNLKIETDKPVITPLSLSANVTIHNPYEETIRIGTVNNAKFQLWRKNGKKWSLISENKIDSIEVLPENKVTFNTKFNLNTSQMKEQQVYLMLKIGELKAIPSKCKIEF